MEGNERGTRGSFQVCFLEIIEVKMDHSRWKMSYTIKEAHADPYKLFKEMESSVESLLKARGQIRVVYEALSEIQGDASGLVWTNNYNNPEIRKVYDLLYNMDHAIGDAFRSIERLERDLKKMVV